MDSLEIGGLPMATPEQHIIEHYGFAFPDDFFRFQDFFSRLPAGILSEACDLNLAFPFDVAAGQSPRDHPENPLWEDRCYHDLPEFVTLFTGTTDGLHWGYFFDAPGEHPPVVVHYWHSDTFEHAFDGDNVFEAVRYQVEVSERDYREMLDDDPGEAAYYHQRLDQLAVIRAELVACWDAERPETADEYLDKYGSSVWRKPTAATWSQLGIVVPAGHYQRLSADPFAGHQADRQRPQIEALTAEAMTLLKAGQPGAALKLGHDLWIWAKDFPECYALLDAAYGALGREPLRRLLAEARTFREWCDKLPRRHGR